MQDIGSDGIKYIGVWELLPEWVINQFNPSLLTHFLKLSGINIGFTESLQDHAQV